MKILNEAGVDITETVKAVFDLAFNSMDHGSGFLDSEEIGHLVVLANELYGPLDGVTLDLIAEQTRMKFPNPEPHEFRPDRAAARWQRCLDCGRKVGARQKYDHTSPLHV